MGQVDSPVGAYDPALAELSLEGNADDEIALIARLNDSDALPEGVAIVTRFGDIVTLRVSRARIRELAQCDAVMAVEAPRRLRRSGDCDGAGSDGFVDDVSSQHGYVPVDVYEEAIGGGLAADVRPLDSAGFLDDASGRFARRPDGVTATGKGVVIGVLDWGCDFAHPAFRHTDGRTRLLALWDQRDTEPARATHPLGYGRIFDAAAINRSLLAPDPYVALDYHPDDDAHGTHVMDIAAGYDAGSGMSGVAPEADLVFVHIARTTPVLGKGNLGDSATVLEALDFVFSTAGDKPCIANISMGAHHGSHDGTGLVARGVDRALSLEDGRAVVFSAGNYFNKRAHAQGRVPPAGEKLLQFRVPRADPTASEVELWYPGVDRFSVEVFGPDATRLAAVALGQDSPLVLDGRDVGHVYHYAHESLNGDNHLDLFLKPRVPDGMWMLRLAGESVQDGHFHAWIERDRGLQPKFLRPDVSTNYTTGTLCNGRLSITVGAYDSHDGRAGIGRFSSAGPTRDGRVKPECVAPGVRICAARSASYGESPQASYVRKTGTSMAAPHVTGAVALLFEAAGQHLSIVETRARLFASTSRPQMEGGWLDPADLHRVGYGYLDLVAVERAGRDGSAGMETGEWSGVAPLVQTAQREQEECLDMRDDTHDADAADELISAASDAEWGGTASSSNDRAAAEFTDVAPQDEWIGREDVLRDAINEDPHHAAVQGVEVEFGAEERGPDAMKDGMTMDGAEAVDWLGASRGAVSLGPSARSEHGLPAPAVDEMYARASAATLPVDIGFGAHDGSVRAGDVLERRAPEGIRYSAVILSEAPERFEDIAGRGVLSEWSGPGAYVEVLEAPIDGGSQRTVGRKLTDSWGRMPPGQTIQSRAQESDFTDSASLREAGPKLDTSAQLTWVDLARVTTSSGARRVFYVVTGAPPSSAQAGDQGRAVFHLRVRNTNSVYNHLDVITRVRLLDILPFWQFRQVSPWRSYRGRELEDESSRVIKYAYSRDTLLRAYRSDSPFTRIEVEYHWREFGENYQRHYNRTGLDFVLVAPIEYMFRNQRRLASQLIPLNDAAKHRADYWIPVGGVDFTQDIRTPVTIQLDVTSTVSSSATRQQTASSRQTRSTTHSTSTSNTFSAQISGELSQGASASASVEILEIGVERMLKLGASLGYSRTRTNTSSTSVANEFARSLMYSDTYAKSQARSMRTTLTISPPRGVGTFSVGVYLYPLIEFVEVPYVSFRGINAMGQATERRTGRVAVPFVREWRLRSHRGP